MQYLNTANIRLRTLLSPLPEQDFETIVLVTNGSVGPYGSADPAESIYGKIFPGFRIPFGSNAALTRFISAISSGESSMPMYGALAKPMPCSPLIDPSSATTRSNSARSASFARARCCGVARDRPSG